MNTQHIYFVSGIDTDAGKSYCTAWLAKELTGEGHRVITQKFIQTGNVGHSEDIDLHRRIMGTGYLPEDREGLTMPEIFSYPCSPHLAARIDGRPIDFDKIERATLELARRYDRVLVEGAGGLMVPLTEDFLTIDYVAQKHYPLVFVTSGKLGSINHTLLSFEAVQRRGIVLDTVLYNLYPPVEDTTIQEDTQAYIRRLRSGSRRKRRNSLRSNSLRFFSPLSAPPLFRPQTKAGTIFLCRDVNCPPECISPHNFSRFNPHYYHPLYETYTITDVGTHGPCVLNTNQLYTGFLIIPTHEVS